MPTLSKLVAALVFGALAYVASTMVAPTLPETVRVPDLFVPVNVVIGLLCGWQLCGAKSGSGYLAALAIGLTAAATMTIVTLLVWAFAQMMQRALRMAYDDAVQAGLKGVAIAIEYGVLLAGQPVVLALLAVGGVIGGLLAEPFAERRPG